MSNILVKVQSDDHDCDETCDHEDDINYEVFYLNQRTNKFITFEQAKYLIRNHNYTYSLDNTDIHLLSKEDIDF